MADEYGGGGFLFGGNTGYTPETLAGARLKLAQAMMQQGLSTEPIRSPWQGAAHMLEAALGGYDMYKMQSEQNAANQQIMDAMGSVYGGSQGGGNDGYFPPAPAAASGSSSSGQSSPSPQVADMTSPSSSAPPTDPSTFAQTQPITQQQTASASPTGVEAYIRQAAVDRGIDPDIAVRVAGHEGLYAFNPNKPDRGGDNGSSFGPFQLHYGGIARGMSHPGLGDDFTRDTGLDARNPSTWRQQVDYALDKARSGGWGPWMGAKAEGITGMRGIGRLPNGAPTQVASLDPGIGMPVPPNGGGSIQPPQAPGPVAPTPGYRDPTVSAPNYVPPQAVPPQQAPGPSSLHVSPEPVPESAYASPSQSPAADAINTQAPIDPTQTAGIPQQAAPQLDPPVNVAANPVPPQPSPQQSAQFKAGAPWDNPPSPRQQLAQAAQSLPPQQNANMQSPQFRALMGVMMNPYASPGARQMAGMLIQQQMVPQYDFQTRPDGSIIAINKRTGEARPVQGPMKVNGFVDGQMDPDTGITPKLYGNPVDGYRAVHFDANGNMSFGAPTGGQQGGQQPLAAGNAQTPAQNTNAAAPAQGQAPAAGQQQQPEKPVGDVKTYRETKARLAAEALHPTPDGIMAVGNKMREVQSYKEYSAALPTFNSMTKHIKDYSPGADKAIVDDFVKTLNPGRAVTTGSFELNMDQQSFTAAAWGEIQKAYEGDGKLSADTRAQMARVAELKMNAYSDAWNVDKGQFTEMVTAHGMKPDEVVPRLPPLEKIDYGSINSGKTTAAGPDQPLSGLATVGGKNSPAAPAAPTNSPTITGPNGEKMGLSPDGKSWVPVNQIPRGN